MTYDLYYILMGPILVAGMGYPGVELRLSHSRCWNKEITEIVPSDDTMTMLINNVAASCVHA